MEGSSSVIANTYSDAVREEGVVDSDGLPLGVSPTATGVEEGVGVLVGEARLVGVSDG